MLRLAKLDSVNLIVDGPITTNHIAGYPGYVVVADPNADTGWLGTLQSDGTYLWTDTPTAQAIRAAKAAADAVEAPLITSRAKAQAIALNVTQKITASGRTIEEVEMRLLYGLISRIAAGNRSALETQFINAVDAAVAANP